MPRPATRSFWLPSRLIPGIRLFGAVPRVLVATVLLTVAPSLVTPALGHEGGIGCVDGMPMRLAPVPDNVVIREVDPRLARRSGPTVDLVEGPGLADYPEIQEVWDRAVATWNRYLAEPVEVTIYLDVRDLPNDHPAETTVFAMSAWRFEDVRAALIADRAPDESILDSLPTVSSLQIDYDAGISWDGRVYMSVPNAKANGLTFEGLPYDAVVTINALEIGSMDLDRSDGIDTDKSDFFAMCVHWIGHALGFVSILDAEEYPTADQTPIGFGIGAVDLFRFDAGDQPIDFATTHRSLLRGDAAPPQILHLGDGYGDHPIGSGATDDRGYYGGHWIPAAGGTAEIGVMTQMFWFGKIIQPTMTDLRVLGLIGWDVIRPADCDDNGIDDLLDIEAGTHEDANNDGVPDACQGPFLVETGFEPTPGGNGTSTAAWGDFDRDGDDDLFVVRDAPANHTSSLWVNAGDGRFDLAQAVGVDSELITARDRDAGDAVWGGVPAGNGVGLFLASRSTSDRIFAFDRSNQGFREMTPATVSEASAESRSVAPQDFDRDGIVDFFVAGGSGRSRLWRTVDAATTVDAAGDLGLAFEGHTVHSGSWCDYDRDGDADLFVAITGGPDVLVRNDEGSGVHTFLPGLPEHSATAGGHWADYDGDGDFDLLVVHTDAAPVLLRNDATAGFVAVDVRALEAFSEGCTDAAWIDVENDGDLDIALVRDGHASALLLDTDSGYEAVLWNDIIGSGDGSTITTVDVDVDGRLDLFKSRNGDPGVLLRNRTTDPGRWITIRVQDQSANPTGIGVQVDLWSQRGRQTREIGLKGGAGQSSQVAHFGLSDDRTVDRIEVRWPTGEIRAFENVPVDQEMVVGINATGVEDAPARSQRILSLQASPNPFNARTSIELTPSQPGVMDLTLFDTAGRVVRRLLVAEPMPAGPSTVSWDGRDDSGRNVASGVYYVEVRHGTTLARGKVAVVK